jgi:glyoxylase-like metal-dependent hydrolase (beta-lactamase superfamily II)
MATAIADGVLEIDTRLGGWERVTAGYLVGSERPVLVETGSQSSLPVLLDALEALGVDAGDLAGIAVTHIHLDHAGGVGDVARGFPNATVYVHPKGARHLADPERLVSSAARVYGPLLDTLYGRIDATPAERIVALEDGDEIPLGAGRALRAIDSPGHAKHHVGLFDNGSGLLFCGDAVGVRLPDVGVLRPATPPPDFDLALALGSIRRFAEAKPSALALAHFGLVPEPAELLLEAEATLRHWVEVAERAFADGADVAEALERAFGQDFTGVPEEHRAKAETLNGVHSNAAGIRRWLEQRTATPGEPG